MDFLRNLLQALDGSLPTKMSTYERRRLQDAFARIVADLPMEVFISEGESRTHEFDASLSLADLQLNPDKTWREVVRQLKTTYPEVASELERRKRTG